MVAEAFLFARRAVTELLKIYVDPLTRYAAERRAAELGESLSGYVRRLIMEDIRRANALHDEQGHEDRADPGQV